MTSVTQIQAILRLLDNLPSPYIKTWMKNNSLSHLHLPLSFLSPTRVLTGTELVHLNTSYFCFLPSLPWQWGSSHTVEGHREVRRPWKSNKMVSGPNILNNKLNLTQRLTGIWYNGPGGKVSASEDGSPIFHPGSLATDGIFPWALGSLWMPEDSVAFT